MTKVMKHVGKVGEKKCVVVFREIPGEEDHCLVVETAGLDPDNHDTLMDVVQSPEGQESKDISQVLGRRQFRDGSNILNNLHYSEKLQKRPVDQVTMTPVPNTEIPLRELNEELKKIEGGYTPPKTDTAHLQQDGTMLESDPNLNTQRIDENAQSSDHAGSSEDQAKGLLAQAELLEQDAQTFLKDADSKRKEAYSLDPSLKPAPKKSRSKGTTTTKSKSKATGG